MTDRELEGPGAARIRAAARTVVLRFADGLAAGRVHDPDVERMIGEATPYLTAPKPVELGTPPEDPEERARVFLAFVEQQIAAGLSAEERSVFIESLEVRRPRMARPVDAGSKRPRRTKDHPDAILRAASASRLPTPEEARWAIEVLHRPPSIGTSSIQDTEVEARVLEAVLIQDVSILTLRVIGHALADEFARAGWDAHELVDGVCSAMDMNYRMYLRRRGGLGAAGSHPPLEPFVGEFQYRWLMRYALDSIGHRPLDPKSPGCLTRFTRAVIEEMQRNRRQAEEEREERLRSPLNGRVRAWNRVENLKFP